MAGALFVSTDPFGPIMAGPAIRCRELALACANTGIAVTVAVPGGKEYVPAPCKAVSYDVGYRGALRAVSLEANAIVVQGMTPARFPALLESPAPLAVDLYCPFLLENLERGRRTRRAAGTSGVDGAFLNDLRALNLALVHGDFFLCADARQRDYWLGALTALHRLNPGVYAQDPLVERLMTTVPFGCPGAPPEPGAPAMAGVLPGVSEESEIILWAGSLSPWFDLRTLLKAMVLVRERRPNATLVLLGAVHPNPDVPANPEVEAARERTQRYGLADGGVHFLPWVPYADRGRYLREATLGVSVHAMHLETHFAFRTRMIDYLWAELPMVLTHGDVLSTRFAALGAAFAVAPGNVDALADALVRGLEDGAWRERAAAACRRLAKDYAWSEVAKPLIAWLGKPQKSARPLDGVPSPVIVPPMGAVEAPATLQELAALQAEAARARELDARLRALDRKLRLLENVPGVGRLLRKRRKA